MKHIKTFESFLNEGLDYTNEKQVITDAFKAFNKKFGTKLSLKNFDLSNGAPTYKYFWSNESADKELEKLKSTSEWTSGTGDYDSLELYINSTYMFTESKYQVVFSKASKKGNVKSAQALFSFPKDA